MEEYTINAENRPIGRVASEAASVLMGKNKTDFARNTVPAVKVTVENASKLAIPAKKMREKVYLRYTGYPSGLRSRTLEELITKHGYEAVMQNAVAGMLPKNKLQDRFMKNLIIKD